MSFPSKAPPCGSSDRSSCILQLTVENNAPKQKVLKPIGRNSSNALSPEVVVFSAKATQRNRLRFSRLDRFWHHPTRSAGTRAPSWPLYAIRAEWHATGYNTATTTRGTMNATACCSTRVKRMTVEISAGRARMIRSCTSVCRAAPARRVTQLTAG